MSPACRPEPHLTCESEGAEKLQESQSTLTARAQRPPAPRSGSHSHPEPPRTRSADPEKDKVRAAGNNAGPTRTDARGTGKRGTQASQATGRGTEAPGRHPSGQTEAENAELLSCFSTQAGGRWLESVTVLTGGSVTAARGHRGVFASSPQRWRVPAERS